jgi:hypothetical protein
VSNQSVWEAHSRWLGGDPPTRPGDPADPANDDVEPADD